MFRLLAFLLVVFAVFIPALNAQPTLQANNFVLNAASYRAAGLPGDGVAQGAMFSIFGTGLGPFAPAAPYTFPLPTNLGGTTVDVTVGGVTKHAILIYAQDRQVNAILPSSTPIGDGTFTVTYDGRTSTPAAPIKVVGSAFGVFTYGSRGYGQAIATFPDYTLNSIIRTFHPGDTAVLWGTGLGPISGDDASAPPTGNLPGTVRIYVGDKTATTTYQGRSGCCAGLDQIAFQIPAGVQGCYVPVGVEIGGAVSNIATLAISNSGQTCNDSLMGQALVDKLAAGQNVNFAYARLESLVVNVAYGAPAQPDVGAAVFSRYTPQTAGMAQYGVSSGYCTAVDCSNRGCPQVGLSMMDYGSAMLDAGASISIEGQGTRVVPAQPYPVGLYAAQLNAPSGARFLWSGFPYTISGVGGANIGAFSATTTTSNAYVSLTDMRFSQQVPISSDFTVKWTVDPSTPADGNVTITGYSMTSDFNRMVAYECKAPTSAHQFTIPKYIMSFFPPSGTQYAGQGGSLPYPLGFVWIAQPNKLAEFTAPGLDRGVFTDIFYNGMAVYFQ